MPLETGTSESAFRHNVKKLIDEGHPEKEALAIAYNQQAEDSADVEESARKEDLNGFITIQKNPISKSGVFQYLGKNLPGGEPDRLYNVWRPASELSSPEAIESFRLLPLIDDHTMLGEKYNMDPAFKGVHGTTGEDVNFEGDTLYSPLRIFSTALKRLMDTGKTALSLGYKCRYEKASGFHDGQPYDYIQRDVRGNHIALVNNGRMGKQVAVLDHQTVAFDHFDLALSTGDVNMADDTKKEGLDEGENTEMSLSDVCALVKTMAPQLAEIQAAFAKMNGAGTANAATAVDSDDDKEKDSEKKAEDADDEEKTDKEEKKEEAMDAAEFKSLKAQVATLQSRGSKEIMAEMKKAGDLARDVTNVVGTFDSTGMDHSDVVDYALKKFNLTAPKGQEEAVLAGYMAGVKSQKSDVGFAMDSAVTPKNGSKFSKTLSDRAV